MAASTRVGLGGCEHRSPIGLRVDLHLRVICHNHVLEATCDDYLRGSDRPCKRFVTSV